MTKKKQEQKEQKEKKNYSEKIRQTSEQLARQSEDCNIFNCRSLSQEEIEELVRQKKITPIERIRKGYHYV